MCNELLKKAVRFHFYNICGRNIYAVLQFAALKKEDCVYKIVPKRTRKSKIIRCAVILLTRFFILRIIQFLKELDVQRTALKSSSFPFLRHLRKKYIRCLAISHA